jgi:hypothetical protein
VIAAALLLLAFSVHAGEATLFNVSFESAAIPSAPEVSAKSPGPGGSKADRAGYTTATIVKSVGLSWNDAGRQGGEILLYAQSVDINFSMAIAVAVTSEYDKDGCPYEQTWQHELSHARAFKKIYEQGREDLRADLGRSQILIPRVPTRAKPVKIKAEDIAAFEALVSRKLSGIVDERARALLEHMDKDRRRKDSEASYAQVYDACASAEWSFRRRP